MSKKKIFFLLTCSADCRLDKKTQNNFRLEEIQDRLYKGGPCLCSKLSGHLSEVACINYIYMSLNIHKNARIGGECYNNNNNTHTHIYIYTINNNDDEQQRIIIKTKEKTRQLYHVHVCIARCICIHKNLKRYHE